MTSPTLDEFREGMRTIRPPVVAFNKSHSGSRLLAQLLHDAGIAMGARINESWDSLDVLEVVEYLVTNYYPDYSPLWRPDLPPDEHLQALLAHAFARHRMRLDAGAHWGWKLCETAYILPVIDYCFPGARFVHLIRDGRDVAFSDHRGPDSPFWRKICFNTDRVHAAFGLRLSAPAYRRRTHVYNALHWVNSVRVGRDFGAMLRERYIEVRYEDLCTDFVATSSRVLRAVDAPRVEEAVARLRGAVSTKAIGKFRTMPARTLRQVVAIEKPLLLELGYLERDPASQSAGFQLGSALDRVWDRCRRTLASRPVGLLPPALKRAIWVHGDEPEQFVEALPVLQPLLDARPQMGLVATAARSDTQRLLRTMFPDERPLPLPPAPFAAWWMRRLGVQHVVLLDGGQSLSSGWHRAMARRRVPVTRCDATASDWLVTHRDVLDRTLPRGPALPPVVQDWRSTTWRDRLGQSLAWRLASRLVDRGRINSVAELAIALDRPRRILCLGNGPSSEDPRVPDVAHDCLMRVNWRWRERRMLTQPQVVFVGDPLTLEKVEGAVVGIWNRELERGMRLRHLRVHGLRTMRYVTMERIAPIISDRRWPARPSNGALMVVLAAALQPEELTIAGIDLFSSPEGRYPGDSIGTNAYSRVHTRETDLAIMREALGTYRGHLTIIGETLREALGCTEGAAR